MTHQKLIGQIGAITDRDYMLYPAGLNERFHLGEKGMAGLHLVDATAEAVIAFVKTNPEMIAIAKREDLDGRSHK